MQQFVEIFSDGSFKGLDRFSDAKLRTEDGATFLVHRFQLALKNCYFRKMFSENNTDVLIKSIDADTMGHVLYYLYTENVSLDRDNFIDIWIAADFFLADSLKKLCGEFVLQELDERNCLKVFLAAWKIDELGLLDECYRYLVVHFNKAIRNCFSPCRNSSKRTTLDTLRDLPLAALKKVLQDRSLNIAEEKTVWDIIVAWFGLDYLKKQQDVSELLKCIYREDVNGSLSTEIQGNPIVKNNPLWNKQSDLEISQNLLETYTNGSRSPPNLHFIAHYCFHWSGFDSELIYFSELYLAFDHKLDNWRKLSRINTLVPEFLVQIGYNIYMFDTQKNKSLALNILDCSTSDLPVILPNRNHYIVVSIAEYIYVLGGLPDKGEIRYDSTREAWDTITPIQNMESIVAAVAMNGCIYAIGYISDKETLSMLMQVYDPESNLWHFVNKPRVNRDSFAAVVQYRGRLYVIGGDYAVISVEEYSPEEDLWRKLPGLPVLYSEPKAIVLEDQLIVYQNEMRRRNMHTMMQKITIPPVFWDTSAERWVIIEESSPLFNVHLYKFCTISQPFIVRNLVKQDRLSGVKWVKSSLA